MKQNIDRAWSYLNTLWYSPRYLAVYGSQNYWLDINDSEYVSDIDYKAIIYPTLWELVKNSKPLSTFVDFEGGQIEIKDIRSYVESAVKCNVNFLEILVTPYFRSEEGDFLRPFVLNLVSEQGLLYLKACYGMMLEKYHAIDHPYPSIVHKIEKFGYDPKQLHHIVRLRILIERYLYGKDPTDYMHVWKQRDFLISIKKWAIPKTDAIIMAESELLVVKNLLDWYDTVPTFNTKRRMIDESYRIVESAVRDEAILSHPFFIKWTNYKNPQL